MKACLPSGIAAILLALVPGSLAQSPSFFVDGFWKMKGDSATYETLVHIRSGSGFYCVLDDKSSFPFQVVGDSITTPMNGKNKLVWYPSSGDIEISGQEKGVPYSSRFGTIDSTTYFNQCASEEAKFTVLPVNRLKRAQAHKPFRIDPRRVLGRR